MLRLPELHRKEFFGGIVARVQGTICCSGIAFEDLRDDWMAVGICDGSGCGDERDGEVAESVDIEPHVDCAEGGGGGAEGTAGVRGGDAAGVHRAARSRGERTAVDSWSGVHAAGRSVLRVSKCIGIFRTRRPEICIRCRGPVAARSTRCDRSGRRLRDQRTHSCVVCDIEGGTGSRVGAYAKVFRGAVGKSKALTTGSTEDTEETLN